MASSVAPIAPNSALRSRVSTLPRRSSSRRSGRSRNACACRLSEAAPRLAPRGRLSIEDAAAEISASRTSSRGRKPASATPSGSSVGRSLAEWTAASIAPATSAMSISLVNRPLPPASASGRSWIVSPVVRMALSAIRSAGQPCASARRRRVSSACASASGEPRVPRTINGETVMDGVQGSACASIRAIPDAVKCEAPWRSPCGITPR